MSYIASFIVAKGIDSVPEFAFNHDDSGSTLQLTKLFTYYRLDKVVVIIDEVFPNTSLELLADSNVIITADQIFTNMEGVPQSYYVFHKNAAENVVNLGLRITGSDGTGSGRVILYITRYQ